MTGPDDRKNKTKGSLLDRILSWNSLEVVLRITPVIFFLVIVIVLAIRIGSISGIEILWDLSDPGVARGLITLLFSIATVWVVMLLALTAISDKSDDEKFRRGKDILTVLVGIFGTIIGYYFGAESQQQQQNLPPIREELLIPEDRQLPSGTDFNDSQQE